MISRACGNPVYSHADTRSVLRFSFTYTAINILTCYSDDVKVKLLDRLPLQNYFVDLRLFSY